jgi:hypothetical protein
VIHGLGAFMIAGHFLVLGLKVLVLKSRFKSLGSWVFGLSVNVMNRESEELNVMNVDQCESYGL